MTPFVAEQVISYAGPYPYIDGLLLQVTQRIDLDHGGARGAAGGAERLYAAAPDLAVAERLAELLDSAAAAGDPGRPATAFLGLVAFAVVLWLWSIDRGPSYGFGWLMSAFLIFSGTQLVMLGLVGGISGACSSRSIETAIRHPLSHPLQFVVLFTKARRARRIRKGLSLLELSCSVPLRRC